MKLTKIDKRMNGFLYFKYKIQFVKTYDYMKFFEVRNWCWDQWGPSCELNLWHRCNYNDHWAWETVDNTLRIYLKTDKEASWLSLTWT
jgi:hypothetical protein